MAFDAFPAFQFYINDWRSSRKVQRMSFKERGMYLELLIDQWESQGHGLVDDPVLLGDAIGASRGEFTKSWPTLRACFKERRDGRIENAKLAFLWRERRSFRNSKQRAGSRGGKAPHANGHNTRGLDTKQTQAVLENDQANTSSLSSSLSSSSSSSSSVSPSPTSEQSVEDVRIDFERFMDVYPLKSGEQAAWLVWLEMHPSQAAASRIIDGAIGYAADVHRKGTKTEFVKRPKNFLKEGMWLDFEAPQSRSEPWSLTVCQARGHAEYCGNQRKCDYLVQARASV